MLYYVAGDWLRRVDAKLGKVTTLLNLVEAAGMKSFSFAVFNGTCKCCQWDMQVLAQNRLSALV